MCGLVGVLGDIGDKEKRMFALMLHFDTLRGPHSTGVISIRPDMTVDSTKTVGTPWDLYSKKNAFNHKGIWTEQTVCLMGHNRYATVGEINSKNAHPFHEGNIIGMHNGTIEPEFFRGFLNKGRNERTKFEVDSRALMSSFNNVGVRKTIEEIRGAWSVQFFDQKLNTVNLFRNHQRPLEYCYSKVNGTVANKKPRTIFWASEGWMIVLAAELCNYDLDGEPRQTKPNIHYFIEMKPNKDKVHSYIMDGVHVKIFQKEILAKPYVYAAHEYDDDNWVNNWYNKGRNSGPNHQNTDRGVAKFTDNEPRKKKEELIEWKAYQEILDDQGFLAIHFEKKDSLNDNEVAFSAILDDFITGIMYIPHGHPNKKKYWQDNGSWFLVKPNESVTFENKLRLFINPNTLGKSHSWDEFNWDAFQDTKLPQCIVAEKLDERDLFAEQLAKEKKEEEEDLGKKSVKESVEIPIEEIKEPESTKNEVKPDVTSEEDEVETTVVPFTRGKRSKDSLDRSQPRNLMVPGPNNEYIDREEFGTIIKKGCAVCGESVDFTKFYEIFWLNDPDKNFLCSDDCKHSAKHNEWIN